MRRRVKFIGYILLCFHLWNCNPPENKQNEQKQNTQNFAALLNPNHEFWQEKAPEVFNVKIATNKGDFFIEVHRDWAPIGADRFYNLVRSGFFDDSRFYRVREGFIAQFGIPGNPDITEVWQDITIPDDPVKQSNTRGTIAYAMTGPDTRTTQLYINYDDNSRLDEQGFAPIGRVIEGMIVVDNLYSGYDESAGGGMRGGKQGKILEFGNAHLDQEFPKLDQLIKASITKRRQNMRSSRSATTEDEVIFGVVEYEILSNDTLKGTWTIPNYDGKLGTEIATGGNPDRLEGIYTVNIFDPDGKNIYPNGKLEIVKIGETYLLKWTAEGYQSYIGQGIKAGKNRLAANYQTFFSNESKSSSTNILK